MAKYYIGSTFESCKPDIEVKNINGDGWRFITDEEVVEKEIDPRLEKLKEFLDE